MRTRHICSLDDGVANTRLLQIKMLGFHSSQVINEVWGTPGGGAQSVKHPTPDFGSGHDLRVVRSSLTWGSPFNGESA